MLCPQTCLTKTEKLACRTVYKVITDCWLTGIMFKEYTGSTMKTYRKHVTRKHVTRKQKQTIEVSKNRRRYGTWGTPAVPI